MLHNLTGIGRRIAAQLRHQPLQLEQVRDSKVQALLSEQDVDISSRRIGPLRRDRADVAIADIQQQGESISIASLTHADEPLARERVERMSDPHKALPCIGTTCTLT